MPISLLLACLWALGANLLAMRFSDDSWWRVTYILIAIGIPLLGYVTYQTGPWAGLICLAVAMSMLRWPLICLWRWLRDPGQELAED
ncbi:MAG: DUF2484 family protein [Rhodobacterales bacterium]|nr:DUF2484 family protein [Rhodobacterales bacterium]